MTNDNTGYPTRLYRRRNVLKSGAAGAATLALAGCIGGGDGGDSGSGSGGGGSGGMPDSVTVPGIYDESGATSDVGRPTAIGSRDTITYINENDLFDVSIDHPNNDYAYEVPQAQQYYQQYTSESSPPLIIGWGTADTEALAGTVADDEVVYVSASYSANLVTEEFPYNFFGNLDYTSQARAHLRWIADNDPEATVGFIFSNTAFGRSPVEGGKQYAEELGLDVASDINLPLTANSATTQLRQARDQEIDYLIHQNTSAPMRVLLEDRQDIYPDLTVCGLTYTVDERVVQQSPDIFEGVRYVNAFRTFQGALDSGGRGAEIIEANFEREGRSMDDPEVAQLNYVRGVIHALLALKGLQNAAEAGNDVTTGPNVRQGMFGIEDDDMFGLAEPFSYAEDDRRPTMNGRLFEVTDGSLSFDTSVELPRRDSWIGL
ncbi:ABC transporter substrate-binding protein [Halorubrum ezzemoulense]|uniref:ABC transporter substrate-binding protein n=1 Tax=Halorubrum ezzemoulense TaxID=337243 RepID=UPI00232F1244|nr:ABC transporter substrate-binding protein [Halorubrum ezzemoulense]MDB9299678.1 ABC transporter substrate-binding protein [Halorubrum ezzemoulense]